MTDDERGYPSKHIDMDFATISTDTVDAPNMTPNDDLRDLIETWRDDADGTFGGRTKRQCADELEAVIDD